MRSTRRLTALIPAHNDDYTLDLCLRSIAGHFEEIVVLDDCSDDATAEVALDAAREHPHVRLHVHQGEQQLGWVEARNRLLAATDSGRLFWLDADDVLCEYAAHALREVAESGEPVVRLPLCELWGDFRHTTGRLRHYDRCHVFVDRRLHRGFHWRGGSAARPHLVHGAARWPGPLFFHVKGVRPDRRLVERQVTRAWLRAGRPGRLQDFAGLRGMSDEEMHRRALDVLLRSRQDRLAPFAETPPLPAVLRQAPERFEMVYRNGVPADRLDHGWRFPR
jgi:hypothetical protein